jgi:hypothetical protein
MRHPAPEAVGPGSRRRLAPLPPPFFPAPMLRHVVYASLLHFGVETAKEKTARFALTRPLTASRLPPPRQPRDCTRLKSLQNHLLASRARVGGWSRIGRLWKLRVRPRWNLGRRSFKGPRPTLVCGQSASIADCGAHLGFELGWKIRHVGDHLCHFLARHRVETIFQLFRFID